MEGTTTSAATAAPSSPSGGNTPAERPTFEQAFAADASPASDPSSTATASPEGPAATGPEATPGEDRSPLIPRSRFDEVVNARKAAEEQVKSLRDSLGSLTPDDVRTLHTWYQRAKGDSQKFLTETLLEHENAAEVLDALITAARQHPKHGQALNSLIGRKLAQARTQTEPQLETIPVEMPDGRTVQLVTADSMAKREAWVRDQEKRARDEALQPILSEREQRLKDAQQAQAAEDTRQWAGETWTDLMTWQGMDTEANRVALGQWLEQRNGMAPNLPREQFALLINKGYREVVLPKLRSSAESHLLDTLQQKAHASTGVAPGSAAPAATTRPRSFDDPSLKW